MDPTATGGKNAFSSLFMSTCIFNFIFGAVNNFIYLAIYIYIYLFIYDLGKFSPP